MLVVDDSIVIRKLMETSLQRLGYESVIAAGSVEAAMTAVRLQQSDVVFVDIALEGEGGLAFAKQAVQERPDLLLVVMTAYPSSHPDVVGLVALGAREYLPKPVQLARLRTVLQNLSADREELEGGSDAGEDETRAADASYL